MRKKYEFLYENGTKTLIYSDMTFEQYTRYFSESNIVTMELLSEYQAFPEDMTLEDIQAWSTQMLDEMIGASKMKPSGDEKEPMESEYHITVGYMMKYLHQPYSEIMQMPARVVFMLMKDMGIFLGQEEYDPNRRKTTIDRKAFQKALGKTSWDVK